MNTLERQNRLAIVTGPSTGVGAALRRLFSAKGYEVIGLSRTLDPGCIDDLVLNLESFESIELVSGAVEAAIKRSTSVVLVNNAGFGQFGAVGDVDLSLWQRQFAVHVFGPIKLAAECLKLCERHAVPLRVVAISSVLSIAPQKMKGVYCAAKAAMNSAHDSFWFDERDNDFLKSVSIVLPGPVATNFRSNALAALGPVCAAVFANDGRRHRRRRYAKMQAALAPGAKRKPFTASADAVAARVLAAAAARRPRPRYFVTPQTYIASFVARFLPYAVQRVLLR